MTLGQKKAGSFLALPLIGHPSQESPKLIRTLPGDRRPELPEVHPHPYS
jgi:hypothetical protein